MPARLHPYAHLYSLGRELTVELLRFLAMLQSALLQFPSFGIHKSNLLETRVVIASYNDHVRLLSPGPWLVGTTRVYPGVGADIVMESITLIDLFSALPELKKREHKIPAIARNSRFNYPLSRENSIS